MDAERRYVYRVDAADVIEQVNEDWVEFARENWDADRARAVVGSSLWAHVASSSVRELYGVILDRVRKSRAKVRLPYRCDSPDVRRFMEMEIEAVGEGAVQFRCRTVREQKREHVPLLDPTVPRGGRLLVMCSWCKKIDVPPWKEAEDAVRMLRLFDEASAPGVSHGLCEGCRDDVLGSLP